MIKIYAVCVYTHAPTHTHTNKTRGGEQRINKCKFNIEHWFACYTGMSFSTVLRLNILHRVPNVETASTYKH